MKNLCIPFAAIVLTLVFLAVPQRTQAVVPAPDGGYPGGNTAEGQNALLSLNVNMGTNNTAVGWFSLKSNVEGQFNTGLGAGTLFNNTASRNTAIGGAAMFSNTAGSFNTAVGMLSLFTNSTGSSNTAIGDGALLNNATGSFNTAVGRVALLSNTTGFGNVATGAQSLVSNTTGDQNTAYGYQAMLDNTNGERNTAVGFGALANNTTVSGNTAVGASALASNTDGSFNTATGVAALVSNTQGVSNAALGAQSLNSNIGGDSNTAIGTATLSSNTFSNFNTAVGAFALSNSTAGGNIALGAEAGDAVTTAEHVIAIGASGENVSNTCYIGNIFGVTSAGATGVYVNSLGKLGTVVSSRRFKDEIKRMDKASEAILALKPVAFRYTKEIDPHRTAQFGLVAEEVEKVNPDLIVRDKDGKPYTVRYDQVNAMLLNEFLKAHHKIEEQGAMIALQQKQIDALTAGLQKVSAQLAAASPSRGGLEASKFATGRIRGGGPAPQVVNNP